MNFGRSINGKEAVRNGEAPASVVARWIGGGITAKWIAANCESSSWHHCNVRRTADGSPTDFYEREAVLARWLLANFLARHDDKAASRRLPALFKLAKKWKATLAQAVPDWIDDEIGDDQFFVDFADDIRGLNSRVAAKPVTVEIIGRAFLTKREYTRSRGRYSPVERTLMVDGARYKGEWLVWSRENIGEAALDASRPWRDRPGRCKRDSIIKLERLEK